MLCSAAICALAGCGQPKMVAVSDAWVRLAAAPGRPAGGYFTIRGGATDQTLVAVTSPAARRIELHETVRAGPGLTMQPLGQLKIPAGATITFAPGGKHLMLFDMARAIGPGTRFPLGFTFADGHVLRVDARAIAPGEAPPS